jgi:glucosamine 6-phosphate synthetase-like amidotransferase/phosphosugar isomerase protein
MENAMLPNDCYRNYMPKEIFEEPTVVRKTIDEELKRTSKIAREIKSEDYEIVEPNKSCDKHNPASEFQPYE